MTIAAIGNSHLLAIRKANDIRKKENKIDFRFYFLLNNWSLHSQNSDFLTGSPKQSDDKGIYISNYRDFFISACGWWAARDQAVEINYPPTHPLGYLACTGWGYDPARASSKIRLVSVAVFKKTIEAWVRQHPLIRLTEHLVSRAGSRVVLDPWPAPSRSLKTDSSWVLNRWYGPQGPRVWRDFFVAQHLALKAIAQELKLPIIEYPSEDILEDGFMDEALCVADPFHANEKYGELVMRQVEAIFSSRSRTQFASF